MFANKFAFIDAPFPYNDLFVLHKGSKIEQFHSVRTLFGDWLEFLKEKLLCASVAMGMARVRTVATAANLDASSRAQVISTWNTSKNMSSCEE